MNIIDRIVSAVGRRVDESSPMVDARSCRCSRGTAIIPPLANRRAELRSGGFAGEQQDSLTPPYFPLPDVADLLRFGTLTHAGRRLF